MKPAKSNANHGNPVVNGRAARDRGVESPRPGERLESKADLDRRLDLALEETFPASDPVSVLCN